MTPAHCSPILHSLLLWHIKHDICNSVDWKIIYLLVITYSCQLSIDCICSASQYWKCIVYLPEMLKPVNFHRRLLCSALFTTSLPQVILFNLFLFYIIPACHTALYHKQYKADNIFTVLENTKIMK